MTPKSEQEIKAAERQVEYLTDALSAATKADGFWLNMMGRPHPRFHPKGPEVSPFNALTLALFADRNGYKSNLFTTFTEAKSRGEAVKGNERGVPFNWYNWKEYVNRHNPEDKISRDDYMKLNSEDKKQYKGIHNREIRVLFNIDQTLLPQVDAEEYDRLIKRYGTQQERGNGKSEDKQLRIVVNNFAKAIKENLVPLRSDGSPVAHYDAGKDAVYLPDKKSYPHYIDYVQDMMREIVRATGHQQRCAREGMVMKGGVPPSQDALKREELIVELAAGIKMLELGLPAKLQKSSLQLVDGWNRDLREDPQMIDTVEADLNNALDVIRKAERGEKVTYFSEVNRQATQEMIDKKKPKVSPRESAILADIIRNHGMLIHDGNFRDAEEKEKFLEKFDLKYYHEQYNHAMKQTKNEDPEIVDAAYTEAQRIASYIDEVARGYKPEEWAHKGNYIIYEALKDIPNRKTHDFVVISDPKEKRADVLMPEGAFAGGKVITSDGKSHNFLLTPDEIMSAEERKQYGAKVQYNELPSMSKQRIAHALKKQGAEYVRFFNTGGIASFRPDDGYFDGKKVTAVKLSQWSLTDIRPIETKEAVEQSKQISFDRIRMITDDSNRWLLYIAPKGEKPFCIHPDKADINQFFSTSKQGNNQDTERIRMELGRKYYAMQKVNPGLGIDIFDYKADANDLSRIERVNLYKTKDNKLMCAASFSDMDEVKPREISMAQWQHMWLAPDKTEFKNNLAVKLFEDILHPERNQESVQEQKTEEVPEEEEHRGMRR